MNTFQMEMEVLSRLQICWHIGLGLQILMENFR